jgi:hypothetical protein
MIVRHDKHLLVEGLSEIHNARREVGLEILGHWENQILRGVRNLQVSMTSIAKCSFGGHITSHTPNGEREMVQFVRE